MPAPNDSTAAGDQGYVAGPSKETEKPAISEANNSNWSYPPLPPGPAPRRTAEEIAAIDEQIRIFIEKGLIVEVPGTMIPTGVSLEQYVRENVTSDSSVGQTETDETVAASENENGGKSGADGSSNAEK